MKISKEQSLEIQKLRKEGKTQMELAIQFKVSIGTIQYHTDEESRLKKIEHSSNYFKGLSKTKRKELYEKHKEYWKVYTKNRYKNEPEYRKRMLDYQKTYKKRKRKK